MSVVDEAWMWMWWMWMQLCGGEESSQVAVWLSWARSTRHGMVQPRSRVMQAVLIRLLQIQACLVSGVAWPQCPACPVCPGWGHIGGGGAVSPRQSKWQAPVPTSGHQCARR